MSNSTLIIDYLGYGLAAARPAAPTLGTGILGLWYSTDTGEFDGWHGSWTSLTSGITTADKGVVINSGTVQINNTVTVAGTAAATSTIAPGSGTSDVVLDMPASGGTVTLAAAPAFLNQKAVLQIKQGATAGVVVLDSGFVFAPSGGPTSFTVTATASVRDELGLHSPDGTHWVVDGLLQGLTI